MNKKVKDEILKAGSITSNKFKEYLETEYKKELAVLLNSKDLSQIRYSQGKASVIKEILSLWENY